MTNPKFVKRKKPNIKRTIILFIILIIVIIIFYNIDKIMEGLFQ